MAFDNEKIAQAVKKKYLVMGIGLTGRAVIKALSDIKAQFLVFEEKKTAVTLKQQKDLGEIGIPVHFAEDVNFFELIKEIDTAIPSPGIPNKNFYLATLLSEKKEVVSEIELAFGLMKPSPLIAVTGTNGKTTTTELIHLMLTTAGQEAVLAGNIGFPLIEVISKTQESKIICLEVSSFQLANIVIFKPNVAVLINITEDHMDWHYDFPDYVHAKSKIFQNQTKGDLAVINFDCPVTRKLPLPEVNTVFFGKDLADRDLKNRISVNASMGSGTGQKRPVSLTFEFEGRSGKIDLSKTNLIGPHNLENIMAAIGAVLPFDLKEAAIEKALSKYRPSDHRLELCGTAKEISFFNDSKATNPDATVKAIEAMDVPFVLIAGGRNKGNSFRPIKELLEEVDRYQNLFLGAVLIGESRYELGEALRGQKEVHFAEDLEEALRSAISIAQGKRAMAAHGEQKTKKTAILFSPACASFDMFEDYKDRGEKFKNIVRGLTASKG